MASSSPTETAARYALASPGLIATRRRESQRQRYRRYKAWLDKKRVKEMQERRERCNCKRRGIAETAKLIAPPMAKPITAIKDTDEDRLESPPLWLILIGY